MSYFTTVVQYLVYLCNILIAWIYVGCSTTAERHYRTVWHLVCGKLCVCVWEGGEFYYACV